MTDASYFEIVQAMSQVIIAITLIVISDKLGLLCSILCGRQCEKEESDEID